MRDTSTWLGDHPHLLRIDGMEWTPERTWVQSTTGAHCAVLAHDARGYKVFLKIDPEGPADWPARTHEIYVALDAASAGATPIAPSPISWSASPPSICYEWAEGARLKDEIGALVALGGHDELHAMLFSVGGALCDLHQRWTSCEPIDDEPPRRRLRHSMLAVLCGRRPRDWTRRVTRSTADLGPWNIVIGSGGVRFIDLETGPPRAIETDIGCLTHRVEELIARAMTDAGAPSARPAARAASRRIVAGYETRAAWIGAVAPARRLVHAAAASDALTVGLYRVRRSRSRADLSAASHRLRHIRDHVSAAWGSTRVAVSWAVVALFDLVGQTGW